MSASKIVLSARQEFFRSMVLGTLLYAVVLGFFNDYTDILHTESYSTTFLVAVVMQILTYLTFVTKDKVVVWFQKKEGSRYKLGLAISVWLIMFLSKFVFLAVISFVFSQEVEISGFVGLLLIIICVTLVQKLVELAYEKLGN